MKRLKNRPLKASVLQNYSKNYMLLKQFHGVAILLSTGVYLLHA